MKNTNTAFIAALSGMVAAGVGGASAQDALPPYSPTSHSFRAQSNSLENRVGQLEVRMSALETKLTEGSGEFQAVTGQVPPALQPATAPEPVLQNPPVSSLEVRGQPASAQGHYHVIQVGESLQSIAQGYGLPVDELVTVNNLGADRKLYAGDRIWVPGVAADRPRTQPTTGVSSPNPPPASAWTFAYQVQPRDTLHSIARRVGVNPQEIAYHNGVADANQIRAGQTLYLPDGATPAQPGTNSAAPSAQPPVLGSQPQETYHYYDVVKGDTVSSVAKYFYTTEEEILRLNGLHNSALLPGQQLVVPTRVFFERGGRQQLPPTQPQAQRSPVS